MFNSEKFGLPVYLSTKQTSANIVNATILAGARLSVDIY